MIKLIVFQAALLFLFSCGCKDTNKTHIDWYSGEESSETDDSLDVPYSEKGGVKTVRVKVNDVIGLDMILDSGCSNTLISLAEANYLAEKGALTEDDFVGLAPSVIADGSVVVDMVIILRKIEIADKLYCTDVKATVSQNTEAPLLLGNEVLDRAASYTIDNINKVVKFKLKE